MMAPQDHAGVERRRYIRLNTVFPVEFRILSLDGSQVLSEFTQSFTQDVNEGGMCLEINNLKDELAEKLNSKTAKLALQINMPFSAEPIQATAQVVWINKVRGGHPHKLFVGIAYETISELERKRIINYAKALRFKPRLIAAAIVVLAIAVGVSSILVSKKEALRKEAEMKLALIEQEKSKLTKALDELQQSRSGLELRLATILEERKELEKRIELAKAEARQEESLKLEAELAKAQNRIGELNREMGSVATGKKKLEAQLRALEEIKAAKPVKVALAKGGFIIGKVVLETEDVVKIEVPTGVITLGRDQISSMTSATEEEITPLVKERMKLEERTLEQRTKEIERKEEEQAEHKEEEQPKQIEAEKEMKKLEIAIPISVVKEKGIAIKEGRVYMDGKPFFIKGVSYGISIPPFGLGAIDKIPAKLFEKDFKMMKEAGINTIRTYEPLTDSVLSLAEKYDLKIIEQVIYPTAEVDYSSEQQLKAFKKLATGVVKKHKNRKCILMWAIWNDAPFIYEKAGNPVPRYGFDTVNNFMKEIYLAIKEVDKDHPVTAANILNVEGSELGFDFLDVIGCNAYIGGHGFQWKGEKDAIQSVEEMAEISKKHNKPVFIMETGYSSFIKNDTQDNALGTQIKSVDESLAGIVIFEWADEWWKGGNPATHDEHIEEHWGILTADRKPKPGFKIVSELFNSIPTNSFGYSGDKGRVF